MKQPLYFGPAGIPIQTKKRDTVEGIKTVRQLGLDAMEIEFVKGVRLSEAKAREVRKVAENEGVRLTVHAPYWINLNSQDPVKYKNSIQHILNSARIGFIAGATSVCFHPAFYQKTDPEIVYQRVKEALEEVMDTLKEEGIDIAIRPETMGKPSQFGSLEEVVRLSKEIPGVLPLLDFAHLHARAGGKFNSYEEFVQILRYVKQELGPQALQDVHFHVSGIDYGPKGERKHLILEESDFRYQDLLRAFRDEGVSGIIICESPNLEEDTALLKRTWESL